MPSCHKTATRFCHKTRPTTSAAQWVRSGCAFRGTRFHRSRPGVLAAVGTWPRAMELLVKAQARGEADGVQPALQNVGSMDSPFWFTCSPIWGSVNSDNCRPSTASQSQHRTNAHVYSPLNNIWDRRIYIYIYKRSMPQKRGKPLPKGFWNRKTKGKHTQSWIQGTSVR